MTVITGNCIEVMQDIAENSVDSVVTDPPYGLSFMGKGWDKAVPGPEYWREVFRVLKPGGHLLAFAGTRTQHRMACAIEDAGFEIRDMIAWVYGSGFPKSHDVSKGIDKAAGAVREVVGTKLGRPGMSKDGSNQRSGFDDAYGGERSGTLSTDITAPATPEAQRWQGWGTALKPALEPITVARKPLDGTVAANVLKHGTGAVNIDGCRVATDDKLGGGGTKAETSGKFTNEGWRRPWMDDANALEKQAAKVRSNVERAEKLGRFPANLIHDGSSDATDLFGDAARFFYCAKASKADRNDGLSDHEPKPTAASEFRPNHTDRAAAGEDGNPYGRWKPTANNHPTVKPTDLMRYLCRLVTPPGGTVLDPFTGSGSTGRGAVLEGFRFIGIELDQGYSEIARARIAAVTPRPVMPAPSAPRPVMPVPSSLYTGGNNG